jgi:hypothetical protein
MQARHIKKSLTRSSRELLHCPNLSEMPFYMLTSFRVLGDSAGLWLPHGNHRTGFATGSPPPGTCGFFPGGRPR